MARWRVFLAIGLVALALPGAVPGAVARDAGARSLDCMGRIAWRALRDGEPIAEGDRPGRWRLRIAADGRATGDGMTGRVRDMRVTGRFGSPWVEAWTAPDGAGAFDLALVENRFAADLTAMRLTGRVASRYARTPYDIERVPFERETRITARCAWLETPR